jgi:predicted acetyltransferase
VDAAGFQFAPHERRIDAELELVPPQEKYMEEVLAACADPLTRRDMPKEAAVTRTQLREMFENWPMGLQVADPIRGTVPAYHFWMRVHERSIAGGIGLRIGSPRDIEMYYGHIGYHVYPPHRGHRYAERACRLLFPLALHHGLHTLWITCNPDNWASRRTCERLGAELVEIVDVPTSNPLYHRGERQKCRYRVTI